MDMIEDCPDPYCIITKEIYYNYNIPLKAKILFSFIESYSYGDTCCQSYDFFSSRLLIDREEVEGLVELLVTWKYLSKVKEGSIKCLKKNNEAVFIYAEATYETFEMLKNDGITIEEKKELASKAFLNALKSYKKEK